MRVIAITPRTVSATESAPVDPGRQEVIINELLCYVSNKISTMTNDDILLCIKYFNDEEISKARTVALGLCNEAKVPNMERYKKRKGPHRTRSNLKDVISMVHDLGTNVPIFVAKDIHKLPPVSLDSLDVSSFLYKIERLDANFSGIKEALEKYTASKNDQLNDFAKVVKEPQSAVIMNAGVTERSAPGNQPKNKGNAGITKSSMYLLGNKQRKLKTEF